MGRAGWPQFGFPRLRRIAGWAKGLAIATDDTPSPSSYRFKQHFGPGTLSLLGRVASHLSEFFMCHLVCLLARKYAAFHSKKQGRRFAAMLFIGMRHCYVERYSYLRMVTIDHSLFEQG